MTPASLTKWRIDLQISRTEACRLLGIAPNTWTKYQEGRTAIPRYIALACAAIVNQIKPWP